MEIFSPPKHRHFPSSIFTFSPQQCLCHSLGMATIVPTALGQFLPRAQACGADKGQEPAQKSPQSCCHLHPCPALPRAACAKLPSRISPSAPRGGVWLWETPRFRRIQTLPGTQTNTTSPRERNQEQKTLPSADRDALE